MKKNSAIEYYLCKLARVITSVIRFIPLGFSIFLGRAMGALAYYFLKKKRRIAYKNLKIAFPEYSCRRINKIIRQTFMNCGQHIIELLYLPWMDQRYIKNHIGFDGLDKVLDAIGNKKGLILLGLHEGSWEVASIVLSQFLGKNNYTILTRDQSNISYLNELLNEYRAKRNCRVVTLTDNLRPLIETLKGGFALGMAADHGGQDGVAVNFFSKPALTPTGAIKLALKLDTNLALGFIKREGLTRHRIYLTMHNLIKTQDINKDIKSNLEAINRKYEEYLRMYPTEYLWFFKRWKYSPRRDILVISDGKVGHLKQSLAVLDLIKSLPFEIKADVVEVKFKNIWHKMLFQACGFFFSRNCQGCMSCLHDLLGAEKAKKLLFSYYDAVVSCGSSVAMVNRLVAYENIAKSIVVMKPGMFSLKRFDLAILPEHDRAPKFKNVVLIKGALSRTLDKNDENIKTVINSYNLDEPSLTHPIVGVLLGGESKHLSLDNQLVDDLMNSLDDVIAKLNGSILISTSRRTPREVDELVKSRASNKKGYRMVIIANESNPQGSLEAILYLSDIVVVSQDSISMVSEALKANKHTLVLRLKRKSQDYMSKHERFIQGLEKDGYIHTLEKDLFQNVSSIWQKRPLLKELKDCEIIIERLKKII
jgi:KDO2-lipid IV(A) lauroyltransferase